MRKLLFLFFIFFFTQGLSAQTVSTTSGHAEVKGKAQGNTYTGVSDNLEGILEKSTGKTEFRIKIETIDTGIKKRNQHMFKALETSEYPFAEFTGSLKTPVDYNNQGEQQVTVSGVFKLHGHSGNIEVIVRLTSSDDGVKFSADWPILITKYGIKRPQFAFFKVKDLHHIYISGILK